MNFQAMNFQVGDRVRCVSPRDDSDAVYEDTGTVKCILWTEEEGNGRSRLGVEWDLYNYGHDLDDQAPCKPGHGWFVYGDTLELIAPVIEDVDIDFGGGDIL